jgi:hypothetical protein
MRYCTDGHRSWGWSPALDAHLMAWHEIFLNFDTSPSSVKLRSDPANVRVTSFLWQYAGMCLMPTFTVNVSSHSTRS